MKKYFKIISIICLAVFLGFGVFAQDVSAAICYDETQAECVQSMCAENPNQSFCSTSSSSSTVDQGGCNPATGSGCIEERGLVPCGPATLGFYYKCDVCGMMKLVDNIIDFLIKVVTPALATIMIVIGAIFLMTAGGSETQLSKGKDYIKMALLGTTIVLTSWLIIDTIMKSFVEENDWGTWNEFDCPQTRN